MYIESHYLFIAACALLAIGYGLGKSSATKLLKRRISRALDQHDLDQAHEAGDLEKAKGLDEMSQYWTDRYNLMTGAGDREPPKR